MVAPFNNLRSKNDRAIVAYLISEGCGSRDDTFPAKYSGDKKNPNTVVHSTISKVEVAFTGNRRIHTQIHLRGQANPDDNDASRIEFDQRVADTMDAMMQSDDNQTLEATAEAITEAGRALAVPVDDSADAIAFAEQNADMVDYTCLAIYEAGEGDGDDVDPEGTAWHEVLMFDVVCCASAID